MRLIGLGPALPFLGDLPQLEAGPAPAEGGRPRPRGILRGMGRQIPSRTARQRPRGRTQPVGGLAQGRGGRAVQEVRVVQGVVPGFAVHRVPSPCGGGAAQSLAGEQALQKEVLLLDGVLQALAQAVQALREAVAPVLVRGQLVQHLVAEAADVLLQLVQVDWQQKNESQ